MPPNKAVVFIITVENNSCGFCMLLPVALSPPQQAQQHHYEQHCDKDRPDDSRRREEDEQSRTKVGHFEGLQAARRPG